MAKKKQKINTNANQAPMGYPPIGFGAPASNVVQNGKGKAKSKSSAKARKKLANRNLRRDRAQTLKSRQNFAIENIAFRKKIEDVQGKGTLDSSYYKLRADKKPKKVKDYFFVMRKSICLIMFLVLLISVAFYAISYLKLSFVPAEYTALFVDGPTIVADEEETEIEESTIKQTNLLDPVFGFVKYVGGKLNKNIDLGDSPFYDSLIAKIDVGMSDKVAKYAILAFPIALVIYVIIAFFMMFKALFGIFGKQIFKKFGLGSILMIICGGITALGGLASTVDLNGKMVYGDIVNILIGSVTKTGGFTGGYGLLLLIVIPLLVLILSMFAKKKIPYSIFDNISV